jgi:excisionase family DNA binding protein
METFLEKKTLSVLEAGRALGIGRSAAYEAARTGQLPSIRIGRRLLVPTAALERLLGSNEVHVQEKVLQARET